MTEFLNLAVMGEVPVVVVNGQRGGPSTGLPTKTEQSDLNIAVFGGAGDSPRPVIAPADVVECYELGIKAFEVAEAFQTPVILLMDLFLCNRVEDITWPEEDRGKWGSYEDSIAGPVEEGSEYHRYALTDDGISPRAIPGTPGLFHAITGLEHNERGFPDYTPLMHQKMTEKRFRKFESLLREWPAPEPVGDEGDLGIGLISWGSTTGAALEALEVVRGSGVRAGGLFPRLIWPVHEDAIAAFSGRVKNLFVVESNHTGQFANIVERIVHREIIRVSEVPAGPLPSDRIVEATRGAVE
jgi:2-oxoglutarate ferredoxin oxidoreductase subunit alpha